MWQWFGLRHMQTVNTLEGGGLFLVQGTKLTVFWIERMHPRTRTFPHIINRFIKN